MKLLLSKSAAKQLLKIPYRTRARIEEQIENLAEKPFSRKSQKLAGRSGYRLRVGDYRVLYLVEKKKIIILSVQHRKDAYRLSG